MDPAVVATVDTGRSNVVVWWTNIRAEQTSSLARNCGAWTFAKDDRSTLDALTAEKICLASPTGRKFLDENLRTKRRFLDPNGTLAGVLAERQRLQMVLETTKSKSAAKPMLWPTEPTVLNLSKAKDPKAPASTARALAIAKWLVLVSEYWESIEEIRLSRPALRKLGDGGLRPLPLVVEPRATRASSGRKSRSKVVDDAPTLPFGD